jgi:Holliday junction resolvase
MNISTEWIDGFLLGDGHLEPDHREISKKSRVSFGVEHEAFALYLASGFAPATVNVGRGVDKAMKQGFKWQGNSSFSEELQYHRNRWYANRAKQPPIDVRITPTSVMLWYLGDGSTVSTMREIHSEMLRLATDGFTSEHVDILAKRLRDVAIACHRTNDNRIMIEARGIPAFFDFIGRKSPVACYDYKFDLPEWRFTSKRMREIADELKVDYQRLAHLVKIGVQPCFRASEKGKPRFLPEHIEAARRLISSGDLY